MEGSDLGRWYIWLNEWIRLLGWSDKNEGKIRRYFGMRLMVVKIFESESDELNEGELVRMIRGGKY